MTTPQDELREYNIDFLEWLDKNGAMVSVLPTEKGYAAQIDDVKLKRSINRLINSEVRQAMDRLTAIGSVQYDIEILLSAIEAERKNYE
jgi:hypothetical protein